MRMKRICPHCNNVFVGPTWFTGKFCVNCYLNWWMPLYFSPFREAAEHMLGADNLPAGHHGSSLECTHPFCVAEREAAQA